MKEFFTYIVVLSFLFSGLCTYAAGYCPSYNEFQDKMNYYQKKAYSSISEKNKNYEESMNLLNEELDYIDNLFPACIQYFKNTENPDCSRATILTTGYIMLEQNKQSAAKSQFNNLLNSLNGKCENEFSFAKQHINK